MAGEPIFLSIATVTVLLVTVIAWYRTRRERFSNDLETETLLYLKKAFTGGDIVSVEQLGDIECRISNLTEVIVVAHKLEEPKEALRAAVQENFQEGVKYTFLVSKSQLSDAIRNIDFFSAIYTIARHLAPAAGKLAKISSSSFDSLLSIAALPGEWGSWPYIFYRYNGVDGMPEKIVAFRGDQFKEGIAENYVRLPAADTQSMFNACQLAIRSEIASLNNQPDFEDASSVALDEPSNVTYLAIKRTAA